MGRHGRSNPSGLFVGATTPGIAYGVDIGFGQSQVGCGHRSSYGMRATIQKGDSDFAGAHGFRPHLDVAAIGDLSTLHASPILVYGNHMRVCEQTARLLPHCADVVASDQGAFSKAHMLICVRYSSVVIPPLPISSMSGSFHALAGEAL